MNFLEKLLQNKKPKYEQGKIYAPVSGSYIPLKDVPDPTFADGILGEGVGIEPEKGILFSPANGVVTVVASTGHAIGITTDDGLELLIHIGLDTVEMKGEGFLSYVKQGQNVSLGEKILTFDINKIHSAGYPATVMFTVTNSAALNQIVFNLPEQVQAQDIVGTYIKA